MMKQRIKVKATTRICGCGVPIDARPGDLVVGNRGAAARVVLDERLRVLYLQYVGNYCEGVMSLPGCRMHDFR